MPISAAAVAAAISFTPTPPRSLNLYRPSSSFHHHPLAAPASLSIHLTTTKSSPSISSKNPTFLHSRRPFLFLAFSAAAAVGGGDNDNYNNNNNNNSGGGGGGGDGGDTNNENNDNGNNNKKNKEEAMMTIAEAGRTIESLPKDLKAAIEDGRLPGSIVLRYFELEKSPLLAWLLKFGGFKERLLADDLFLAKVAMECGVGIFTKTAAEYERRRENFFNEIEIVVADVVMAIIADFMLVYLPAPTVSLRPPIAVNAGGIAKFFYNCPDNAFQVVLPGTSYSLLQRLGAIARNGAKLFAVGTTSSLVGTVITNAFINAKKAVDKSAAEEVENVPVLSTSVAYGVYMAVSSNLRYQILAGVIEQRILEPLLHQHKLVLSALCFAVRTGNTFLGSLLWVDYARLIGIQKAQETESKAQEIET